eukprot:g61462.t1
MFSIISKKDSNCSLMRSNSCSILSTSDNQACRAAAARAWGASSLGMLRLPSSSSSLSETMTYSFFSCFFTAKAAAATGMSTLIAPGW